MPQQRHPLLAHDHGVCVWAHRDEPGLWALGLALLSVFNLVLFQLKENKKRARTEPLGDFSLSEIIQNPTAAITEDGLLVSETDEWPTRAQEMAETCAISILSKPC
jgi:hypothetical protein